LTDAKGRLDKVNKELETTVNKQKEVESQIAAKNKLIQDKQVQHKAKLTQRNTKAAVLVNLDSQLQQKSVLIQQLQEQTKRIEQGTLFDTYQTQISPVWR
jgi:Neuraminidase (sialidase)